MAAIDSTRAVQGRDVYVLSDKGEAELKASETSLTPAEIELLVRIDGKLTVDESAEGVRILAPEVVPDAIRKLLDRKLIRMRPSQWSELDGITGMFDAKTLQPSQEALSRARAQASKGATALQKSGYYVRIARRDASKPALPAGRNPVVIVIEDEPLLAKFLKQYLTIEGMAPRLAANRTEILEAFRAPPPPDLVLLDVMLPDADGFDILLKLRQHPTLKKVPVIMLTAKATREAVLKGLAGGADGYITKPFEVEALIKAVRAVMGAPKGASGKAGLSWY